MLLNIIDYQYHNRQSLTQELLFRRDSVHLSSESRHAL